MDNQELEQARIAVENILNALGVARVVYVDDANNEGTVSLEDTIAAALSLDPDLLVVEFPELGVPIPDDQDVLTNKVRKAWDQLDASMQEKRGRALVVAASRLDGNETDDIAYVSRLGELVPPEKLTSLSPAEWENGKKLLLDESRLQRTLFLFDQDLGTAGDSEGGIRIIASLLSRSDATDLICGLLTHTVTPDTQPQQWVHLSNKYGISRDRFVVIPKLHLDKTPILFAQTLKFAALSPAFTDLKQRTKAIITQAAEVAAKRVDDVSIYDLDHIVFQASAHEGLWEPDMLFRLHAMFHRLESRRLAHEGGILEEIAARLRAVSKITTDCAELPPPPSAWALQREELYESGDHINQHYLPLELGDIFERVGADSTKKYILLAQPCDLAVRSKGEREPKLHRVPLAEVAWAEKAPKYAEEMPYFDESPKKAFYVKLKMVYYVRICILDLCVLSGDGIAQITLNQNAPLGIRPAWKARHDILQRYVRQLEKKADLLNVQTNDPPAVKEMKKKITQGVGPVLFSDDPFTGKLADSNGDRKVIYNCKRVGRISRARAIGLLMSYTSTLGRPAYDLDFGRSTR